MTQSLINTQIDRKNINLAKLVKALRQELDIYCLISVNADSINKLGIGKKFFGYLQNLAIASITLSICKIYEHEKEFQLNSISGIFKNLRNESAIASDNSKLRDFIEKYNGKLKSDDLMIELGRTIKKFRKRYKDELGRFKTFRDKSAAHSEFEFPGGPLPSYDVMEELFLFAADFCELVYRQFVGVGIANLTGKEVKSSLKRLLEELGFEDIKTEMQ